MKKIKDQLFGACPIWKMPIYLTKMPWTQNTKIDTEQ